MTENSRELERAPIFCCIPTNLFEKSTPTSNRHDFEIQIKGVDRLCESLSRDSIVGFSHTENESTQWFFRFAGPVSNDGTGGTNWVIDASPVIEVNRTRRTRNAVERFQGLIKSILYKTNVNEVCLAVAPNDLNAIDMCGRIDLRWNFVLFRYRKGSETQPGVSFHPDTDVFNWLLWNPSERLRSSAIMARCRHYGITRAHCDHDDVVDMALGLGNVASDGFVLPIFVLIEILDWLPEMETQNAFLKLTWLQRLEASMRRCAASRRCDEMKKSNSL